MKHRSLARKAFSTTPAHALRGCDCCKTWIAFDMPEALVEAACNNRLVLFAGAGISTETSNVLKMSFYDEVREELKTKESADLSFSALMSLYCAKPDGRIKLLRKIRDRFTYIEAFPELYRIATRFHEELSTIPQIKEIITTNWDTYFEQCCGCTPFLTPQDFAFWDVADRKVHKIHGSITSYGSIIATTSDYERCHSEIFAGLIGANLRMLLATKTILFAGYSLRDDDFARLYDALKSQMGNVLPQPYVVTRSQHLQTDFEKWGSYPS